MPKRRNIAKDLDSLLDNTQDFDVPTKLIVGDVLTADAAAAPNPDVVVNGDLRVTNRANAETILQVNANSMTCKTDVKFKEQNSNVDFVIFDSGGNLVTLIGELEAFAAGLGYRYLRVTPTLLEFTDPTSQPIFQVTDTDVTFGGPITLPTATGTPTPLDYYEEFSVTPVLRNLTDTADFLVASTTITIRLVRIGYLVTMYIEPVSASQNSQTTAAVAGAIPARFRKSSDFLYVPAVYGDDGAVSIAAGYVRVDPTTGDIELFNSSFANSWSGAGLFSLQGASFSWYI